MTLVNKFYTDFKFEAVFPSNRLNKYKFIYTNYCISILYTAKPRFNVPAFSEIPDLVMIFSCHDNSSIQTNKPPFNENLDLVKYILIPQQFIK
jgi:hypothetical protein